jgi:hypothetical protein
MPSSTIGQFATIELKISAEVGCFFCARNSGVSCSERRNNARIGRGDRNEDRTKAHDRQRHDQSLAAADPVDVGAEHDGADRPHQGAEPERREGEQQSGDFIVGRKKGLRDIGRVEAEQEEIEHFQEIAPRRAQDGADRR